MAQFESVSVRAGNDLAIEAVLTRPVFAACQTAYLQVANSGGLRTEFGIRIERGAVIDVYLWDGFAAARRALSPASVELHGDAIVSRVPWRLVSSIHEYPELTASLVVNGGVIESGFPVRLGPLFAGTPAAVFHEFGVAG